MAAASSSASGSSPPQYVVLIRHAQAEHNVACDWSIPDPPLTALGEQQASSLPEAYPNLYSSSDVILTSPLRRTIQTTLVGFPLLRDQGVPLELWPDLQETQAHPCDVGSSRATLEKWFKTEQGWKDAGVEPEAIEADKPPPEQKQKQKQNGTPSKGKGDSKETKQTRKALNCRWLDFSSCADGWQEKTGKYAASEEALVARALHVRQRLKARQERSVTVVCHAGFLRHIVRAPHSQMWKNVEARVYTFAEHQGSEANEDLALLERVSQEEEQRILGGSRDVLVESY